MPQLSTLTSILVQNKSLSLEQAHAAANALASEEVSALDKKGFLIALSNKGETIDEVAGIAQAFRELARDPELSKYADRGIDIVGTGGTKSGGYNISSVSSMICAAAGVPVLKHGNRAITSSSGSADFLGHVGVPMDPGLDVLKESLDKLNFCYFFAPAYHPAFKSIMPVRKELAEEGVRTVFNILGPLINPAKPAYQLLGVFNPSWVQSLAEVLGRLGLKNGVSMSCELPNGIFMDELTSAGENIVCGFGEQNDLNTKWCAEDFGFKSIDPVLVRGGSAEENFAELKQMMAGNGRRGLAESIAMNAGCGLHMTGVCQNLGEGAQLALDVLLGGKLAAWVTDLKEFYSDKG